MRIELKPGAIYSYCKAEDISRDEMSRRMGVASTTAFRVEKGATAPSAKFIAALMHLTARPFEDLFVIVGADRSRNEALV